MANTLQNLSGYEAKLLIRVIEKPSATHDQDAQHKHIGHNLLHLLKSGFIASFSSGIKIDRYSIRNFSSTQIPSLVRDDNGGGR